MLFLTLLLIAQDPLEPRSANPNLDGARLSVIDRYGVPIPHAKVSVWVTNYPYIAEAFAQPYFNFNPFLEQIEPIFGDDSGFVSIPLGSGQVGSLLVEQSGYAPRILGLLFPGYEYEVMLHLGQPFAFSLADLEGNPVADAVVSFQVSALTSKLGATKHEWTEPSNYLGGVVLEHFPIGQALIYAYSPSAGSVIDLFECSYQYGAQKRPGYLNRRLALLPTREKEIQVVSKEGVLLDTAEAFLRSGTWSFPNLVVQKGTIKFMLPNLAPPNLLSDLGLTLVIGAHGRLPAIYDIEETTRFVNLEVQPMHPITVHKEIPSDRILAPAWPGARSQFREYGSNNEREVVLHVADGYDVFGLTMRGSKILNYLQEPGITDRSTSKSTAVAHTVAPATLIVEYSVDGQPLRTGYAFVQKDYSKNDPVTSPELNLWGYSGVSLSPTGEAILRDVLPGTYRLALHAHYTIYEDSLVEVTLAPGDSKRVKCDIRHGKSIRGKITPGVMLSDPKGGLILVQSLSDRLIYDNDFDVAEDGTFCIQEIVPEEGYRLLFFARSNGKMGLIRGMQEYLGKYPLPESDAEIVLSIPHPTFLEIALK